jgi:hypothetical protein
LHCLFDGKVLFQSDFTLHAQYTPVMRHDDDDLKSVRICLALALGRSAG